MQNISKGGTTMSETPDIEAQVALDAVYPEPTAKLYLYNIMTTVMVEAESEDEAFENIDNGTVIDNDCMLVEVIDG